MFNVTATTPSTSNFNVPYAALQESEARGPSLAVDPANNLGYGVGRLVRTVFDRFSGYFTPEVTAQEKAERKQNVVKLNQVTRFLRQLDEALGNLQKNPRDPSAFKRVEKLVIENGKLAKFDEKDGFRAQDCKSLEQRILTLKPELQEKLGSLLPTFCKNSKIAERSQSTREALPNELKDRRQSVPCEYSFDLAKSFESNITVISIPPSSPIKIAPVGDINKDGIGDFAVGLPFSEAPGASQAAGLTYVIWGGPEILNMTLPGPIDSGRGIVFEGIENQENLGAGLTGLGDINNDGNDDFAIRSARDKIYVLFGPVYNSFNLTTLDGNNGFIIPNGGYLTPFFSISGGGDINCDGIPDMIGLAYSTPLKQIFAIFGHSNPWPAQFDINSLNGLNGFLINPNPNNGYANFGNQVKMTKNRDDKGCSDFSFTDPSAGYPDQSANTGITSTFFGHNGTWDSPLNLTSEGFTGFLSYGPAQQTFDLTITVNEEASSPGNDNPYLIIGSIVNNIANIIFQRPNSSTSTIALSQLNPPEGIKLPVSGWSGDGGDVAIIDLNNDGYSDVVIGIAGQDVLEPVVLSRAGRVAVLLGQPEGFSPSLDLRNLSLPFGFWINGISELENFGFNTVNLGDIRGNGRSSVALTSFQRNSMSLGTIRIINGWENGQCPVPNATPTPSRTPSQTASHSVTPMVTTFPTPSFMPSTSQSNQASKKHHKTSDSLPIGLGVGLGVGATLCLSVCCLVVCLSGTVVAVYIVKRRKNNTEISELPAGKNTKNALYNFDG